jgi:hypothetical protein
LLSENLKSNDLQLTIRHNDDYDSELTDFEEDSSFCLKSSSSETKSNIRDDEDNEENASGLNGYNDDKQMDFNNNNNNNHVSKSRSNSVTSSQKSNDSQTHRSIRLKDLNIVLTEPPGSLTRSLQELIKSMNTTGSTVNPSSFHSAFCKKYGFVSLNLNSFLFKLFIFNLCLRIPHFKGFQQHDSHELLRNLLDSIKSEELKVNHDRFFSTLILRFCFEKKNSLFKLTREDNRQF